VLYRYESKNSNKVSLQLSNHYTIKLIICGRKAKMNRLYYKEQQILLAKFVEQCRFQCNNHYIVLFEFSMVGRLSVYFTNATTQWRQQIFWNKTDGWPPKHRTYLCFTTESRKYCDVRKYEKLSPLSFLLEYYSHSIKKSRKHKKPLCFFSLKR
jgi:hypothetical protein